MRVVLSTTRVRSNCKYLSFNVNIVNLKLELRQHDIDLELHPPSSLKKNCCSDTHSLIISPVTLLRQKDFKVFKTFSKRSKRMAMMRKMRMSMKKMAKKASMGKMRRMRRSMKK